MRRRIYVASSWRNPIQQEIVEALKYCHDVYDFRNPAPGVKGFGWKETNIDVSSPKQFMFNIERNDVALRGYEYDKAALDWCDTCVMVLPCGRSAHLEAGYACGQGKQVIFYLHEDKWEPELMYLLGDGFVMTIPSLLIALNGPKRNSLTTYGY